MLNIILLLEVHNEKHMKINSKLLKSMNTLFTLMYLGGPE